MPFHFWPVLLAGMAATNSPGVQYPVRELLLCSESPLGVASRITSNGLQTTERSFQRFSSVVLFTI